MKKNIITLLALSAALSFHSVHAQVSAQKNVTLDEIYKELNVLSSKGDDASKAALAKEAAALAASKNEVFVNLGARVYESINESEKAEAIQKSILKKFPKGIKARQEAYNKIFTEEATAATAEKGYASWLKQFPSKKFDASQQAIYGQALSSLAILNFKAGHDDIGQRYVQSLANDDNYPSYANTIARTLLTLKKNERALPILKQAYEQAFELGQSTDPKVKNSMSANRYYGLASLYAKTLTEQKDYAQAMTVLQQLFKEKAYASGDVENVKTLALAQEHQGLALDAFQTLDNYLTKEGNHAEIVAAITPLYSKLNNDKGDITNYLAQSAIQFKEASVAKYKATMIKKEAPAFSLVDRSGKTVTLSELKGKVVVLDFWATWCGPCKVSFPGMQVAVNKYKDDADVVFLFIDTWQREENYKEVVNKFIDDNKYTFHVLFDEMKDREKATTTAYGVKGIPHKVVIDKEGFIRFETSGSGSDIDKIVNEMETKIELARKG